MRFYPSKSGFLAANWAGLKHYLMNPHVNLLLPDPRAEGAPNGSYERMKLNPVALQWRRGRFGVCASR